MKNEQTPHAYTADGARLFKGAIAPYLNDIEAALTHVPADEAGTRLHGLTALHPLLANDGCIGAIAATVLGPNARPVRAILFNKTPSTNWALPWHQDRTICVKMKRETSGFGPWTVKGGMIHVEPPFDLLTRMVTLRAHIDHVPASNAPLLVALGSHACGRISFSELNGVISRCKIASCLADAGDVWLYSTPILHASNVSADPINRRVLQVDFAAEELPNGLEWLGV